MIFGKAWFPRLYLTSRGMRLPSIGNQRQRLALRIFGRLEVCHYVLIIRMSGAGSALVVHDLRFHADTGDRLGCPGTRGFAPSP